MNKIITALKYFIIISLVFILVSCAKDNSNDNFNNVSPDPQTDLDFLMAAADMVEIPTIFTENYSFIRLLEYQNEEINITWKSDKTTSISNFGIVKQGYCDENVTLTATFTYKEEVYIKKFNVIVSGMSPEKRFSESLKEIVIPEEISENIDLLTNFNDKEMKATWISSHPDIISNTGAYNSPAENTIVTLTVTLELGSIKMEKNYEVNAQVEPKKVEIKHHLVLDEVKTYNLAFMSNCHIEEDKLVLDDEALNGTYFSNIFEVQPMKSVVASWGALSSETATVEIEVRIRVNGKWSRYFSYGAWGLGLQNKPMTTNTNDGIAKISTDEIIVQGGKTAEAIQYRVTLRRDNIYSESAKLSFVALAIEYDDYEYKVNVSSLPERVEYIVPKLNQNVVPVIGNSICSPTSSTMLLKYKGHSFIEYDEYENRYIANLAKDYGNEIFGNWVYCTVIMTAYGEKAYVMRMYSIDELKMHLAKVGPVALSVKGKMDAYNTDNSYTTNGHLLVCQGYYEKNGQTIFICNDPNVKEVYVEYLEETIERVWRMVSYIIE